MLVQVIRDLPDVVVVVLDCARSDVLVTEDGTPKLPEPLNAQIKGAVVYDRAVSPATWTGPAHASLLTGLYPWTSGCFGRRGEGFPSLDARVPRVQDSLRPLGYSSLLLSGNPTLGAEYGCGLNLRFDRVVTAEDWEHTLRFPSELAAVAKLLYRDMGNQPPYPLQRNGGAAVPKQQVGRSIRHLTLRIPTSLLWVQRLASWAAGGPLRGPFTSAPWIEDQLRRSLQHLGRQPFFAVVNLIDAHEPYYPDAAFDGHSLIELRRQRQDFSNILEGRWSPSPDEYSVLRDLYAAGVAAGLRRVTKIIQVLQAANRWEDTLFILTSDHGQALGEHGLPLHGGPPVEGLVRVPLIVRFPRPNGSSFERYSGWTSLVDVAPTVLAAAGVDPNGKLDGVPLQDVDGRAPPSRKVFSYGEGLCLVDPNRTVARPVQLTMDREGVAGYSGRFKLVRTLRPPGVQLFDVLTDCGEQEDLYEQLPSGTEDLSTSLDAIVYKLSEAKEQGTVGSGVSARLTGWGYG